MATVAPNFMSKFEGITDEFFFVAVLSERYTHIIDIPLPCKCIQNTEETEIRLG